MRSHFIITKTFKIVLALLLLFVVSLITVSGSPLLHQLINRAFSQTEITSPLEFIGTGEPQIQVLHGIKQTELLSQILKGAKWSFSADGKFMFIPSENANLRNDLYPITGSYKKVGDTFEFQAERRATTDASASVDGVIREKKDGAMLEVTQVTNSKMSYRIARISQTLSPASQVIAQSSKKIQGVQVPSTFKISLNGKTEAQAFDSLAATLKISSATAGDPNPFLVNLQTERDLVNGSLMWSSFSSAQVGRREFYSKITINGNQVRLDVNPSQEQSRLDISWTTLPDGQIGELIEQSPVGVQVKEGFIIFSIQGDSISGKIQAEGISWFGKPSRYEAEFTGQIITENSTPSPEKQIIDETSSPFEGSWKLEPEEFFGTLKLQQNGQRVQGTYSGRGGGTIDGTAQGNRLDFTWQDRTGKGWGLFRAIPNRNTLAGMWGIDTDKTIGQNLIATQMSQNVSPTTESPQDMRSLRDRGYDLVLHGKCQQAIEPLKTALSLFKQESQNSATSDFMKVSALIDVANIQTRLSHCYFQSEDYQNLVENLNDVIETRKLLNQRDYIAAINNEGANSIQSNLTSYAEGWRQRLDSDVLRIEALENWQPFLQNLMRLFVDSGNYQEALLVAEKSKARAFADLLAEQLSPDTVKIYATPPTIQQLQQIVKDHKATLVEYAIVEHKGKESELFIWVVKPTGEIEFQQVSLQSLQKQNTSLGDLITYKTKFYMTAQEINDAYDPSPYLKQLYQLLIKPISQFLPSDPNDLVIFIPHRSLFYVPFPSLLDANDRYLIQKHTTLISPSIQVLDATYQLAQPNRGVAKDSLVVGNPTLAQQYLPLKDWEPAANEIAKQLNTKAIIGAEATKAKVLQLMPHARIIHLATHAGFKKEKLSSWIALAPSGGDDGLLTAKDIFELYAPPQKNRLYAELIVLAACQTGQGDIKGDGVIGLSRSLIASGIPSTVVSLSTVKDESTIFLMKEFYKHLSSGKAYALRQAMLATMKEYPNKPGTWARFALIGEAE